MGKTPDAVYSAARPADDFDEAKLREAMTIHARRRMRRDNTPLHRVDPERNAHRSRNSDNLDEVPLARVSFDPPAAALDRTLGRPPRFEANDKESKC